MKQTLTAVALSLAFGVAVADAPVRDAAWYTTGFDGGDLQFAKAECKAPTIPSHSVSQDGARRVERAVKAWRTCFTDWHDKVIAVLPAGKEIPDTVAKSMSPADMEKAKARMNEVYSSMVADALAQNDKVNADIEVWIKGSRDFNKGVGMSRDMAHRMERQIIEYGESHSFYRNSYNLLPKRPK
jgi:hypothetical protein